jgi:hypothetical protein
VGCTILARNRGDFPLCHLTMNDSGTSEVKRAELEANILPPISAECIELPPHPSIVAVFKRWDNFTSTVNRKKPSGSSVLLGLLFILK